MLSGKADFSATFKETNLTCRLPICISRAYGMTAQSFNDISSSVKSKSSLQRKIMLQAYNYK